MEKHFELSNMEFEIQFSNCILDPAIFSHEAHLRLAWIHIKKYGVEKAVQNICTQLLAFVTAVGEKNKFNETVTIAAIKAVYHFMKKSTSNNFPDFIHEFPRLKYNFKELMAFHYKKDIYISEKAKQEYLEPDLLPFD